MINKKQVELLQKNGYEVLPEVNFIKEPRPLDSIARITYDPKIKKFGINIFGRIFTYDANLINYKRELDNMIELLNALNSL